MCLVISFFNFCYLLLPQILLPRSFFHFSSVNSQAEYRSSEYMDFYGFPSKIDSIFSFGQRTISYPARSTCHLRSQCYVRPIAANHNIWYLNFPVRYTLSWLGTTMLFNECQIHCYSPPRQTSWSICCSWAIFNWKKPSIIDTIYQDDETIIMLYEVAKKMFGDQMLVEQAAKSLNNVCKDLKKRCNTAKESLLEDVQDME